MLTLGPKSASGADATRISEDSSASSTVGTETVNAPDANVCSSSAAVGVTMSQVGGS